MKTLQILLFLSLFGSIFCVTRPPLILTYTATEVPFKASETVQLLCRADGVPNPLYTWKKDDTSFDPAGNDDRIVKLPNEGTLVFNRPEAKDVGMYQCFAKNAFGSAMSLIFDLRLAFLEEYPIYERKYERVQLGDSKILECVEPKSYPDAELFWVLKLKEGGFDAIDYDRRVTMDPEGRLIITNVEASDHQDGRAYACMAMNAFVRRNTQGREYIINTDGGLPQRKALKKLFLSPSERTFLKGDTVRLKCIWGGNPTPKISWTWNGKAIEDGRVKMASFGQELRIEDAKFEDEGKYECTGQNSVSSERKTHSMIININSKPEWTMKPESIETSVGSSATFLCNATSKPPPDKLVWYINGVDVNKNNPFKHKTIVERTNLTIFNLVKQDSMTIQCNVSNNNGYVFTNVYLNVLEEAPEFTESPKPEVKVAEGQSVNLTCRTTGQPVPKITWFKDKKQMTGGRYRTQRNGNLNIKNLVVADAGEYKCQAKNTFGRIEAQGILIVRRQTRIEQFPFDLEANLGTDAKFTCAGTTDPMEVTNLSIYWLKDYKPITTSDQRMIQNFQDNSLTISGITKQDAGKYTCVATNKIDDAKASADLTVRAKPEAPSDVQVICENLKATISWIAGSNNNAPIQFFVIQSNTTFEPDQWYFEAKVEHNNDQKTISLSPYATYSFRVLAQNKIGESEPSNHTATACTTPTSVPTRQPLNVHTRGDIKNYLNIMWTPMRPIMHNGPDFEYSIIIKKVNTTVQFSSIRITDWRTSYQRIQTNDVYVPYEITMNVKNRDGEASANHVSIIGHSGEDLPELRASNLQGTAKTSTEAVLTFDGVDPTSIQIRGKFTGYKVQFWKRGYKRLTFQDYPVYLDANNNANNRVRRAVGGSRVSLVVDNLYPYSDIVAQILVMNSYYVGGPSEEVSIRTPEGVPGPVPFLIPSVRGSNHFLLQWDDPSDKNGLIIGYNIAFQTVNGLNLGKLRDMEPQIREPNRKQIRLSGLRSAQLYRVYIWALTTVGQGVPYYIEVQTIKPSIPSRPTFTFVHIDFTYVNITWPLSLRGDLHGSVYYVEYRKEDASDWQQTTDESVLTWKNVTHLESGTSYEFRLVATNGKETHASGVQVVTTYGHFVGFAWTSGWLYGMLIALLILIGIVIALYVCRERIAERRKEMYKESMKATRNISSAPEFQDERGYNNDYVDPHDDSFKKSHSSMGVDGDGAPNPSDEKGGYDDRDYDDQYDDGHYEDAPYDDHYQDPYYENQYDQDDDNQYEDYEDYPYDEDHYNTVKEIEPGKEVVFKSGTAAAGAMTTFV